MKGKDITIEILLPSAPDFSKIFEECDKGKKGYLNREECIAMKNQLMSDLRLPSTKIAKVFSELLTQKEIKATAEEIKKIYYDAPTLSRLSSPQTSPFSGQRSARHGISTAEQMIPAARIIYVFQLLKNKFDMDKRLLTEVDWCIDQIAGGKIYENQLLTEEVGYTAPSPSKSQAMPWLAQFSTPRISMEEIQAGLNQTSALVVSNPEQLAKKDQERVKRRSVIAKDLAEDIRLREQFMETIDSENFNVSEAETILGRDKVLPVIAFHIFQKHGIFSSTAIDENAFVAFISEIRKGYVKDNPYHNDVHAADVLQMCHFLLTKGGVQKAIKLSPLDTAALLLSAIIHDFRHPGVTNGFLANSSSDLAIAYNDRSILENYHVSESYKIMLKVKDCNLFQNLTSSEKTIMRKRLTNCVLATDMVAHNEMLTKLQNLIIMHNIHNGVNAEKVINPKNEFETKQFMLDACLHLSDVGNPCREFATQRVLVLRLLEEFGRQGDIEKSMKMPVSFLCDRTTINVPVSQVGYINGVVKPLLTKLSTIFPGMKPLLVNLTKCEQEWKKSGN